MGHPAGRLDNVIHQRVRLGILTILARSGRADFVGLRDELGLTDGNLSRNLQVLQEAGYVAIDKTFEGQRPKTWVSTTPAGRAALREEIDTLRELFDAVDGRAAGGVDRA